MATKTGGFKQVCPSCEAAVPIKDASLVGRKIDCPKCKYRFIVEAPDTGDDDEDLPAKKPGKKGSDAVTAKKPANGKANGKPAAAVKSKGRRRDEDEDEEAEAKPKKRSGSDSKKLILGLVVAGFAVALLAVAAIFIFNKDKGKKTLPNPGPAVAVNNTPPPPPPKLPPPPAPVVEDITNLLPNDTQLVINISVADLLNRPIGMAAFQTPGAFNTEAIKQKLGFSEKDIERILVAGNYAEDWLFLVVRLKQSVMLQQVADAMGLIKGPESPVQGQEYFVTIYDWISGSSSLLHNRPIKKAAPGGRPLAVRLIDPKTLVMADLTPMKALLAARGAPKKRSDPDAARRQKEEEAVRAKAKAEAPQPKLAVQVRRAGSSDNGDGRSATESTNAGERVSHHYLTIDPLLKDMMDLEETRQPLLFSMADSMKDDKNGAFQKLVERFGLRPVMSVLGFCVQETPRNAATGTAGGLTFLVGMDCESQRVATTFRTEVRQHIEVPLRYLAALLGINPFTFTDVPDPVLVTGQGPRRGRQEGTRQAETDEPEPTDPAAANARAEAEKLRAQERDNLEKVLTELKSRMGPYARLNGESDPRGSAKVTVSRKGGLVLVELETDLEPRAYADMPGLFGPIWIMAKGQMEKALGKPRVHDLAAAASACITARNKTVPRGTHDRPTDAKRGNRPYPPDQRVSWMADLMPYLPGYETLGGQIDFTKSWQDPANFNASITIVPQFLGHNADAPSRVAYPELHVPFYLGAEVPRAASHFVGIAGVGPDAASLPMWDTPELVKRLGVFGYDRETRLEDILDGTSNTIMIAEAAPPYYGPWIAGGGSTIRSAPDTNSISPFVASEFGGKRGAMVIMADGSVRFVADTVSDQVFKALCTIKGKEFVDINTEMAKVPPPAKVVEMTAERQQTAVHVHRAMGRDTDGTTQAQGAAAGWQEVASAEGKFTVLMPGAAMQQKVKPPQPMPGGPAELVTYVVMHDNQTYTVAYGDLPSLPPGGAEAFFANAVKEAGAAGLAVQPTVIALDDKPGREFVMNLAGQVIRTRVYLAGQRVYQLVVTGPAADNVTAGNGTKFMDSFKLR